MPKADEYGLSAQGPFEAAEPRAMSHHVTGAPVCPPQILRRVAVAATALLPAVAALLALASPASASPALTATSSSVTNIAPNTSAGVTGLSVSGDSGGTVQVTVATDVGTLAIPSHANLTLAYANNWSGDDSITFLGSQEDVDTALATASLSTGANTGATAHVTLTALMSSGDFSYLAPNGHFYQYVPSSGISWTDADADAEGLSFDGQAGYLATIPTAAVNDFLTSKIPGASNVWFGARAYEAAASDGSEAYATVDGSTYDRVWRWTVGADESPIQPVVSGSGGYTSAGVLAECDGLGVNCDYDNAGDYYQSWAGNGTDGEPNGGDASGPYANEWTAVTNYGSPGKWNDLPPSGVSSIDGYLVEYGGKTNLDTGTGTGFSGIATSSSSILIEDVPSAPAVTATRGNGSVSVSFDPPADNGSAITGYQISTDGGSTWNTLSTSGTSTLTGTVTGLLNGTTYQVKVRALNGLGNGTPSTAAAVTPATNPGAPTTVTALRGNASATVSWTAPVSNGGTAVTGYTVTSSPGGLTCTGATTSCSVSGLTNGTAYTFTVHATNGVGSSGESTASTAVTPATVPGAPTAAATIMGNASATVSWTAPVSNGGTAVTGYTVTSAPGGLTCTSATTSCTVTGLTPGTAYTFTVHATNAVGNGSESTATSSATAITTPSAPTVTATRGNGAVTVSFAPPANNGSAITGYEVSTDGGSTWNTLTTSGTSTLTGTVTGLLNGTTYQVKVRALNGLGNGTPSTAAAVTPATNPGAPTNGTALRGNASAAVSWAAPVSNGGTAVTGYTVTSAPGGLTCTSATTGCTVSGLTNGTAYTFTVHATNAVGNSAESTASTAVTPATVPAPPTTATSTMGNASATVAWTAPMSTGGTAVTGYTVTSAPGGLTCTSATTSCTVTGLTPGTSYTFTVHATNAVGSSSESESTTGATAVTTPGPPTGLAVAGGPATATLSFGTPGNGSSPITGYQVSTDGGITWNTLTTSGSGSLSAALTGLANGTAYPIAVRAVNAVGAGPASTLVTVTPATLPGPPTSITAVPQGTTVVVSWTPPASDGGAPITAYTVTASPGGTTCTTSGTSCSFPNLPHGVAYTFAVAAVTTAGSSDGSGSAPGSGTVASTPNAVMVGGAPSAPTAVHTTSGDRTLTVRFTPPADDGGSPITGYRISLDGGKTWKTLKTTASGSTSTGTVTGVTNGARYSVVVRAVNGFGESEATAVQAQQVASWFKDPMSTTARKAELPVPAKPGNYRGPVRLTRAVDRAFNGTAAMDVTAIRGRQLQPGQAATLGAEGLFAFDKATLTPKGKALIRKLVDSLRDDKRITCEGYTDYGGSTSHQNALSLARATAVCRALKADGARVTVKTIGYGALHPVVVGGSPQQRAASRRVVVVVTG